MNKPVFTNGCEWSEFIGLSEPALVALFAKLEDPSATEDEKRQVRHDLDRIATQDENWLANCQETTEKGK